MTLHVIYSNATGSTQDLTTLDTIRLPGLSVTTNAEEGSVAISNLVVDDIGATLDLVGLRRVYIWESAEDALNQMIWTGFLGAREISRGPGQPPDDDTFVLSTDRRWSCELVDVNSLFSRRIITGTDGDRPAETDVQRIAWLISTNYVFTVGTGNSAGYFNQSGGVAMDAADLRGQTGFDVMNDCAQRSGKNWFMFYDEGTDTAPSTYIGNMSLFYDFTTSTTYSSTLRLTNVDADVDDLTTFAVLPDAILRRDPGRIQSGIYLSYDGGTLYAQRAATGDTFAYRDAAAPNSNVKTAAKASALATRYLNDADTEDGRITCRFVVPKEKVNHLKEGQRVRVKFSHLPGASSAYAYARCLRRTVTQRADEMYEIGVELTEPCSGPAQCACSFSPLAFGGTRPNRLALGYPSTTDTLEAFADTQFHIPAPWLTTDTWTFDAYSDYTGGCGNIYNLVPSDSLPMSGQQSSQNGGQIYVKIQFPAIQTSYAVVYGTTAFTYIAPAFLTPPRANVIEIGRHSSGGDPTSLTLVVDGTTVVNGLGATISGQNRMNLCSPVENIKVTRFVLPSTTQGRTWEFTLPNASRPMSIAGYLDPDDDTPSRCV